jgi:hypothetical protein
MFRLIWAPERFRPSGGVWLDWLPGVAVKDRNEMKNKPWRRSIGVRSVRRYGPLREWVLEKWVPAHAYGTRDQWYKPVIIGGTMLLCADAAGIRYIPSQGEYPSRGDYEYTGYAFTDEQLSEASVLPIVQALIRNLESLPTSPARRVTQLAYIANMAAEAADKQYENWALEVVKEYQPAFSGQAFTGSGTKRPHSSAEILKRLKIGSHHIS